MDFRETDLVRNVILRMDRWKISEGTWGSDYTFSQGIRGYYVTRMEEV